MAWCIERNDSKVWWMRYRDKDGSRRLESTNTEDWDEAQRQLRERLKPETTTPSIRPKGEQLTFGEWADFFLENYSKPPIRAQKTHEANERALKTLRPVFGTCKLWDIDADEIEAHLAKPASGKSAMSGGEGGIVEIGPLKATTVHQEFRVLRRMFNVAVKKKLAPANPCSGVEFPVMVKGIVPAPLHDVVGAAADREACACVPAERDPDHHGDGTPGVQGTGLHDEGPGGPGEQGGVDRGFEDANRSLPRCH